MLIMIDNKQMTIWNTESNAVKMKTVGKVKLFIVICLELTISKQKKKLYKLNSSGRQRTVEIKSITKRNSTKSNCDARKCCQTMSNHNNSLTDDESELRTYALQNGNVLASHYIKVNRKYYFIYEYFWPQTFSHVEKTIREEQKVHFKHWMNKIEFCLRKWQ